MEAPAAEAALTLRIPAWAQSPSLAAPEHLVQAPAEGAVQLRGTFTAGDRIVLDLPLEARFVVGHLRNDAVAGGVALDRKSTRLNSSHVAISYAVCCLKKKDSHEP